MKNINININIKLYIFYIKLPLLLCLLYKVYSILYVYINYIIDYYVLYTSTTESCFYYRPFYVIRPPRTPTGNLL